MGEKQGDTPFDIREILYLKDKVNAAVARRAASYPSVQHPSYQALRDAIEALRRALDSQWADDPCPLDRQRAASTIAIQDRPVFIGGPAKSGTTLVRSLLDGHPQLAVYPVEGCLFALIRRYAQAPFAERREAVLQQNFSRLVTADLGGGPHWLLSGGVDDIQPYLDFVAYYRQRLAELPATDASLIRAIIFAYLLAKEVDTEEPERVLRWVEKAPTNALDADDLLRSFSQAKLILCVRDPRAIIASTKFRHLKKYGNFQLQGTSASVREALGAILEALERHGRQTCHIVRYEDLVTAPRAEMERLASFLMIQFHDTLLEPAIAGLPAYQNTGYRQSQKCSSDISSESLNRWRSSLSQAEIDYVSGYMRPYASQFGYEKGNVSLPSYLRTSIGLRRDYYQEDLPFSLRRAILDWW